MHATEAADQIKEVGAEEERAAGGLHKFENQAALLIAFLAMLLAVTSVAGNDNLQTILQAEMQVTDTYAFYQAKSIRRTSTILAKDQLELQLLTQGAAWTPEARQTVEQRIAFYNSEADRYRTEEKEGMNDLLAKAQGLEHTRERAMKQDPNFDYAEGLFQIAIVIASVSIITKLRLLLYTSAGLGLVALLLLINGFTLVADLPF